jgi:predicted nucleic acid-binding protein
MIALDTNVITGLWLENDPFSFKAQEALERAHQTHTLMISAVVYAELLATLGLLTPSKSRVWLDSFLEDVGIEVDWTISETMWLEAGQAFATYAKRRRKGRKEQPRRILADFLIAAHAKEIGSLLSADTWYKTIFPNLELLVVK